MLLSKKKKKSPITRLKIIFFLTFIRKWNRINQITSQVKVNSIDRNCCPFRKRLRAWREKRHVGASCEQYYDHVNQRDPRWHRRVNILTKPEENGVVDPAPVSGKHRGKAPLKAFLMGTGFQPRPWTARLRFA